MYFLLYVTILIVSQTILSRMEGRLMNNDLEKCGGRVSGLN